MSETLPEEFTVRSVPGIFRMKEENNNVFTGKANGYELRICVSPNGTTSTFSAFLNYADTNVPASQKLNGEFISMQMMENYLASWMNEVCKEQIEDYAEDVKYFQTSGGKLAYWAYNTHLDTTPIVFVHGGPGGDSNPVKARRLCLENPVYLFDQMGCGQSDPIEDYDAWVLEDYITQMKEFIDSIPAEKVIIIGASWGSGLSVSYADATSCEKIAAMILPSPYLSSKLWTEDMWQNLESLGPEAVEIVKNATEKNNFGPEFLKVLGEYNSRYLFNRRIFREYALASAEDEPNETFLRLNGPNDMATNGKLKDFDITPALGKINVPVLFICADSDEVTVPRIIQYHNAVKGSRLSIIPNAGHVLALEQFDLYRDAIVAFLRELGL